MTAAGGRPHTIRAVPSLTPARNAVEVLREIGKLVAAQRAQEPAHSPAPPASGLVLDIGAGHAPFARADIVVDKYPADDFERETTLSFEKPLVVADGEAMPFADGTFAYVIASHVIEHAIDPLRFAAELSRIADAGFVQVPSRESELTFGWPFHPWLIDLEDGVLVFRPRGDQRAPIGQTFHESAAESYVFRLWMGAHRGRWYHSVHWKGSLPVRCEGSSRAERTASVDVERTMAVLREAGARGPSGEARRALRCPADGGELEERADHLHCRTCGRAYPFAGTVPVLLTEAAADR